MRRRVVALALTLMVTGTPEAFAICQMLCASSSVDPDIASHEHSAAASHHSQAPVSGASINIQAHQDGCHLNQVSPLIVPTPERASSPTIVTAVVVIQLPQSRVSIPVHSADAHRSAAVPLHTLRI